MAPTATRVVFSRASLREKQESAAAGTDAGAQHAAFVGTRQALASALGLGSEAGAAHGHRRERLRALLRNSGTGGPAGVSDSTLDVLLRVGDGLVDKPAEKFGADCFASANVPVPVGETGNAISWVTFCVIGGGAQRHNHPGRPDQASAAVASATGREGNHVVFAAVERPTDAYAWAPAVAVKFPLYDARHPINLRADRTGAALLPTTYRDMHEDTENYDKTVTVNFVPAPTESREDSYEDWVSRLEAFESSVDMKLVRTSAHHSRLAAAAVDAPCSEMRTTYMLERAQRMAVELNARVAGSVTIITIIGDDLRDQGFGGIYGVGKCAEEFPPALAVLSYQPEGGAGKKSVCLVGKGIVFDTGGLSLKGPTFMPGMKADMGGAAAVLHGFAAIAETEPAIPFHAVLCLAENAIGHKAQKPDDIVYMHSGKTVELNNTDAEGRLVLGDGVSYASRHLNPGMIVDIATLTGAQGVCTGQRHAALLADTDSAERAVMDAAAISGNLTFPILFAPELLMSEFDSKVADMKNSVKNRANAQSSCAGLFIHAHLDKKYTGVWAHVDCAYPAVADERGTGFGTSLLAHLVRLVAARGGDDPAQF